ncbi:hypothetical protein CPB86DRAFT_875339 [Serendipita vermifera]|nr:hypothetical protein CPB86DRAFT_875339 [Serendipita vermifera]
MPACSAIKGGPSVAHNQHPRRLIALIHIHSYTMSPILDPGLYTFQLKGTTSFMTLKDAFSNVEAQPQDGSSDQTWNVLNPDHITTTFSNSQTTTFIFVDGTAVKGATNATHFVVKKAPNASAAADGTLDVKIYTGPDNSPSYITCVGGKGPVTMEKLTELNQTWVAKKIVA